MFNPSKCSHISWRIQDIQGIPPGFRWKLRISSTKIGLEAGSVVQRFHQLALPSYRHNLRSKLQEGQWNQGHQSSIRQLLLVGRDEGAAVAPCQIFTQEGRDKTRKSWPFESGILNTWRVWVRVGVCLCVRIKPWTSRKALWLPRTADLSQNDPTKPPVTGPWMETTMLPELVGTRLGRGWASSPPQWRVLLRVHIILYIYMTHTRMINHMGPWTHGPIPW